MVIRHEGMILIHQRPHGHTHQEILPHPVLGHGPAAQTRADGNGNTQLGALSPEEVAYGMAA
jgi:hypothetical protein